MSAVLQGIRVLDLGRYIAGPFCAALLADFGADVIRVDRLGGSEDRFVMPVAADGTGAIFMQVNRGKRSITLDIESPRGREVVRDLVRSADVVVVNMPPDTLRRLGLDYDALRAVRPDVIVAVASAFGMDPAVADRVGFDGVGQAMSGAVYASGMPLQPAKAMVPVVDFSTALACALGVMAALLERRGSGQGQLVEASLLRTALNMASGALIEESLLGLDRRPSGNRSPIAGPSDIFRVRDGWIIVQVIGQPLFNRWAALIGRPEVLDDPRFADDRGRGEHGEQLSRMMADWCAGLSREQALAALEHARIPAGPVNSPRQALRDEVIGASGAFCWVAYPGLERPAPLVAPPVGLSRTPPALDRRSPTAGEHTDEVLAGIGYDAHRIGELRRHGVI
ncbi:CaiB/BaiF CoA transferase family protein [Cupriavidus sp. 30B13]|uniref:CaiB/BaiF CoA transferase family protein n=1 Tax=Cupriavidus sp. 30B13 TaxID=3384241 RepID=UPI003B9104B0